MQFQNEKTQYKAVIGLEIHVQLLTKRKLFAEEGAIYGAPPNTQTSPTTLAHPGTMPTLNKKAVIHAIMIGLACEATITRYNYFDRKNYWYPDLPKGFQITQDKTPICVGGKVIIDMPTGEEKVVHLARIHLEEDTGKSNHLPDKKTTLINFDRAGLPLIEIVTKPILNTPEEAALFLTEIRRLVRYLGISNGNMEEGSLRCDANVSVMPKDSKILGNKVELKNMNSIRHVRLALKQEITRQTTIKDKGGAIVSQTRSYDAATGQTVFKRKKEGLTDYRFFTEPDLSPFIVDNTLIEQIKKNTPPLPRFLAKKFEKEYGLPKKTVAVLTDAKGSAMFFEAVCTHTKHYKNIANWVVGPIKSYLNAEKITWKAFPLSPKTIATLVNVVQEGLIGFSLAVQKLFPALLKNPLADPYALAQAQGALVHNEEHLKAWVIRVLEAHPDKVAMYHKGKEGLIGFFMGEVMRISNKRAHPKKTMTLLKATLTKK